MWSLNLARPRDSKNKLEAGNKLEGVSWTVELEELESWS